MDDSAVFAVRAKYAEDLEDLVQCPVCFERPKGAVSMCVQGHSLCKRCRDLLYECPVCKSKFSVNTRNFVAEELCSKLNEIISSLLEPQFNNSIALPLLPVVPNTIKKSISTQTENPLFDESVLIIDDDKMSCCRIGFCQSQLPADCMYHHVCDYHSSNLIEVKFYESGKETMHEDFKIKYDFEKLYDFAVYSKKSGMFFMNVHIDKEGDVYFILQTTNASQENKYSYELYVDIPRKCLIRFNGVVPTNLTGKKYLQARKCKKDCFKRFFKSDMVELIETDKRTFDISLVIGRI